MKWMLLRILPVLIILSLLLGACSVPPVAVVVPISVPSAIVVPTDTPAVIATNTSPVPVSDDVWDRITANKKIVIGVSWDYPPFAYVDSNFQVVGFDIALSREIGKRLNVPVDIKDFTFDGLPGALQLNQIDMAIAAIAVTPERTTQMTFSPIYYVNQTAVLARSDSQVQITDLKQLAGYRVGVRRGSVFESMLQDTLVTPGLMGADKLLSYMQADDAVRDLVAKRVDLVLIGQATAKYYSTQQGLQIVGKNLGQQDQAIAMRLGTPRLNAEIDKIMTDMLTDGTILGLAQQYLQNDAAMGLPTAMSPAQSTATALPPLATAIPAACLDGMGFVSDLTYADTNMASPPYIAPGTQFVKTWRVENTGNCTWTQNYKLVYAYGNVGTAQMNGQPIQIPANVAPGHTIDLSVNLTAPQDPLTYQGFWQMENAAGFRFGQTIWVGITTQADQVNPVSTILPPTGNYCQVLLTTPVNPVVVNSSFEANWLVTNISPTDWSTGSVDYKFVSGTAMPDASAYDLGQTIKSGNSGNIIAKLVAPATPGTYTALWAIVSGNKTLCLLTLNVVVVAK
jgi:ABC-type amino acid transport substrate-binding protein